MRWSRGSLKLALVLILIAFTPSQSVFANSLQLDARCSLNPATGCTIGAGAELELVRSKGFYRLETQLAANIDSDSQRSYFDFKKLNVRFEKKSVDLLLGSNVVHWGVMETRNIVDVINQRNYAMDFRGFDKFGQPMVVAGVVSPKYGRFEAGYLPYFKTIKFAQDGSYPGFPLAVESQLIDGRNSRSVDDYYLRWEGGQNAFNYAFAYADLIQRTPLVSFLPEVKENTLVGLNLLNEYEKQQFGLFEFQYLVGDWAFKFEGSSVKQKNSEDYSNYAVGVERAYFDAFVDNLSLRVSLEYYHDDRGRSAYFDSLYDDVSLTVVGQFYGDNDFDFVLNYLGNAETSDSRYYGEFNMALANDMQLTLLAAYMEQSDQSFAPSLPETSFLDINALQSVLSSMSVNDTFVQLKFKVFF